jgi:hypothetical protein
MAIYPPTNDGWPDGFHRQATGVGGGGESSPLFSPGRPKQLRGLGRVGPDSVSEWAGLVGCCKAGLVAQFGRGPHPAQEAGFIKISFFKFILVFHNSEVFQKNCRKRITTPIKVKQILLDS